MSQTNSTQLLQPKNHLNLSNINQADSKYFYIETTSKGNFLVQKELRDGDVELDPPQRITSPKDLENICSKAQKPLMNQLFFPFTPGCLRASSFTIFSSSVGAGVLSLPKIVSYYGLGLGIVLIILASVLNYQTFMLLDQAITRSKKRSYANIVAHFLGKKLARFNILMTILTLMMVCCIYATLTWNFAENLLTQYNIATLPVKDQDVGTFDEYDPQSYYVRSITLGTVLCLILLLLLQNKLGALRYLTIVIISTVICTILVSMAETPSYYSNFKDSPKYKFQWGVSTPSMDWIPGIATIGMSYACQPNFVYIRAEMISPTRSRVKRTIRSTIVIEAVLFLMISVAGYVSLGADLLPDIYTQRPRLPGSRDLPMTISKFIFLLVITLHIPLCFVPAREQLYTFFRVPRRAGWHFGVTLAMSLVIFSVPILYPDVLSLFGIFGGTTVAVTSFIVPFLLGFKMEKRLSKKILYLIGVIIFTVLFLGILIIDTLKYIKKEK